MFEESHFPGWCAQHLVSDEEFGNAYEAVAPELRALLKTNIALQHSLYGTPAVTWTREERHWRHDYVTVHEKKPADWCCVLLSQQYNSAPRLLAALMPALLAGVEDVMVVRMSGDEESPWPVELLAALELAGQENVISCHETMAATLFGALPSDATGRVLMLGDMPQTVGMCLADMPSCVSLWAEPYLAGIGLIPQEEAEWNVDVLKWAHPDWNMVDLSEVDDISTLGGTGFAAIACNGDKMDTVPDTVPFVLGSGQEACWVWPDLLPEFFMHRRLNLLSDI